MDDNLNLNAYLVPNDAPISQDRGFVSALNYDSNFETNPLLLYGNQVVKGAIGFKQFIVIESSGATGGGEASFYTSGTTFMNLNASRISINSNNYPGNKFYLSATYRAGTNGEAVRTFIMDLLDSTTGSPVPNSQISGTNQDLTFNGTFSHPIVTGTVDFKHNLTVGTSDYEIRFRSDTNGLFVDLYEARIIIDS